jgi:hypothetical protein
MPISRLYATSDDALATVKELKEAGFREVDIHLVTSALGYVSADYMVRKGVVKTRAEGYATAVRAGAAVLIVAAPFGSAAAATEILDAGRPGDAAGAQSEYEAELWDEATPMSSILKMPVLSKNPTPVSDFCSLPVLSSRQSPAEESFGIPTTSRDPAPLSGLFGMKVLLDNAAPLSSKFGWKTLIGDATPLSSKAGMAVLSDKPSPLSDMIGLSTLSKNPAPLSSLLGLKVLTEDPS